MAIGLFIFAIIIQKFTFSSPKDIPAHIDELQVVGTAINIYNGSINPEFFRYPSGHINILALLYIASELLLGDLSISDHYQIAWYLSNLYMAMIPVLVYVMCQLLFSQKVGVLGGLISSISPLLLYHSQYSIVDIPMTFYVTLFFTYAAYCYKNNKLGNNSLMILGTITGIAISMKYTAGLLIPPLLLMSYNYNQSRRTYFLSDKYYTIITYSIVLVLLSLGSAILIFLELIKNYFESYTTDGIVEIEYVRGLKTLGTFGILVALAILIVIIFKKNNLIKIIKNIISPTNFTILAIVFFTFFILSPFTIIEYKAAFGDFMYESRHMKIGSAAQYHHLSDQYKNIIENLNQWYPLNFYYNLLFDQFGLLSILLFIFGLITVIKEKIWFNYSLFVFFILMLFTLITWQNVAARYFLCLIPIVYLLVLKGFSDLLILVNNKLNSKSLVFYCMGLLLMFDQLALYYKFFY